MQWPEVARAYWASINLYLVTWGQNVCRPVYPRCGDCVISADCPQFGVTKRSSGYVSTDTGGKK